MSIPQYDKDLAGNIAPALRMLFSKDGEAIVKFFVSDSLQNLIGDKDGFKPVSNLFASDKIVHTKCEPLFIELSSTDDNDCINEHIASAFEDFSEKKGYKPKVVAASGLGCFALGKDAKEAECAKHFFIDAVKIAVNTQLSGDESPLPKNLTDFTSSCEAEPSGSKVSVSKAKVGELDGKIAVVTGGAQGFGKGLAESLAAKGAYVVVADLNFDGAKACAEELCNVYGNGSALPVKVDVSDEGSVKNMVQEAVLNYGGLDILISNAGILIAGSLSELSKESFDLVTKVNYTGYFLCAKYGSVPMKVQRKYAPDYLMDIIEINSKSGLEGSNKNFAYAGSKFGGIGLTQSFALELAPFGIKVNAICPGNYLDGPLWSDPERGLFRQYFDSGKVEGAKTKEDVRKFYESKVPLGRGCLPEDVACAVVYAVSQKYETGQAIPVTGGQVMLR